MIHLRIVVPAYQSEHALDLLDATPTVCNLVYLERAARRPVGDVILCDVAREDASLLIADLRELNIDTEGSIAIEEIDSAISSAALAAEAAATDIIGADPVVWEQVAARTHDGVELSHSFLIFMALSMMIGGAGIMLDQTILIIGAMVVGPEFGSIAGLCVAMVNRHPDLAKRSGRSLLIGFPVGIGATWIATLLLRLGDVAPSAIDADTHPFTQFIAHPDFFSFYIAALAGIVGMLSLTAAKSSALVGVLISVTTIPAAANIAVAAAYGNYDDCWGAILQLTINMLTILLSGLITLYVQRRLYVRRRARHLSDDSRRAAGLPIGHSRREPGVAEPGAR